MYKLSQKHSEAKSMQTVYRQVDLLVSRPEEYCYSSARNYINQDHSIIKVNTEMLGVIIE